LNPRTDVTDSRKYDMIIECIHLRLWKLYETMFDKQATGKVMSMQK